VELGEVDLGRLEFGLLEGRGSGPAVEPASGSESSCRLPDTTTEALILAPGRPNRRLAASDIRTTAAAPSEIGEHIRRCRGSTIVRLARISSIVNPPRTGSRVEDRRCAGS